MKMEVAKGVRVRLARRAVGGRPAGVAGPVRPLSQLKYRCYMNLSEFTTTAATSYSRSAVAGGRLTRTRAEMACAWTLDLLRAGAVEARSI